MSTAAPAYTSVDELPLALEEQGPPRLRRLLLDHPRILVGLLLLLFLVVTALVAPWIAPRDPLAVDPDNARLAPGLRHLFGTDELGRDMLSRVIWGGRISMPVAFVAVAVGLTAGGAIGLTAGYRGGGADLLLMRLIDGILAFPALILAIALVAALGPSLRNAMIAIGIVQIPVYARLTRAQVLQLKGLDFITASRALGASAARIIGRHMLPNLLNPLIVQVTLSAAAAMLAEATLSFLGLSAPPPTPDWGFMINTGQRYLINGDWWLTLGPGAAICIAVFGFNWLGDALRDALDPRLRR
ncbi:MAG TPA: ABC transporter permease [Candidatus Dormibacteraeota bacterium]|nr:ABC transporter permease [Candidatus Dormibacteraeota bacterium]